MITMEQIQQELLNQGYAPGVPDGIIGRRTRQAIEAFQIQHPGLVVDGIPGPKTLAVLFKSKIDVTPPEVNKLFTIPWLDLAITKKGLNEKSDNAELKRFLRSDGGTVGDPAQLPWCGDFVETCIAVTLKNEFLPSNPYLARNWQKFGCPVEPTLGAVAVFWRGARTGISGHVTFLVGKGNGVVYCLGGNQSNSVSIASMPTARLLAVRWPLTHPFPAKFSLPTMKNGVLSVNEE